jgi:hypothetical protein
MNVSKSRRPQQLGPNWKTWPIEAQVALRDYLREIQSGSNSFKTTYRNDRVAFTHDCIDWSEGGGPTAYQDEINAKFDSGQRRIAVRMPHGGGKTALAALNVIHFALTRDGEDWKCPTTASAWRQLAKFLWPEIHKWTRKVKWDKVGRTAFTQNQLQSLNLKLSTGEAFALASSDHELIEGAHADNLLYLFDEAKAIDHTIFDAAEGALMTGDTYALAISTPGEPIGRFYDIHRHAPGYEDWWTRHVTIDEMIAANRITAAQVEQRRLQWGESSAVFQNRVLGEFCASDEDAVIPLAWVEAANDRWNDLIYVKDGRWNWKSPVDDDGNPMPPVTVVGVDISRSENGDKTVVARRHGDTITILDRYAVADTMPVVGYVHGILEKNKAAYAVIDVIGIGGGPVDRLREMFSKQRIQEFNASEKTDAKDRSGELQFANKRSYAWWHMRELLDPAYSSTIALPPDDKLIGDLTAPHRGRGEGKDLMTSSGKILIESKKDVRKRIGRSTDDGDAVVMAFFPKDREPVEDNTYSYSYVVY